MSTAWTGPDMFGPGWRLAWADSELASIVAEAGGSWRLQLSAAAMRAGGDHAEGAVEGYARGITVVLHAVDGGVATPPARMSGRIRGGRVLADGRWIGELALPCSRQPAQRIELQLAQGQTLTLTLSAITVEVAGDARFFESMAC